ncbi:unnamed protein product [Prorocentrum cordatum]|uniref:Uncharacterized protein n=1 Tax=Prorocentrum cordatum TaxID=2364126 RepID=A0ABN9RYH6_9DINO|nr:unnamed protein product [Polarella glacialis]
MHFRQCRACFDVLVGPSVACGHCGAEVHAHCMQVVSMTPVCYTCLGVRDMFLAQRRATWTGHMASQMGRAVASGSLLAGQVVGATAIGVATGATRLISGAVAGARQTLSGASMIGGPARLDTPQALPQLAAGPPSISQAAGDGDRVAALEAEIVRLRAELESRAGGYATPGGGSGAGLLAPATPQPQGPAGDDAEEEDEEEEAGFQAAAETPAAAGTDAVAAAALAPNAGAMQDFAGADGGGPHSMAGGAATGSAAAATLMQQGLFGIATAGASSLQPPMPSTFGAAPLASGAATAAGASSTGFGAAFAGDQPPPGLGAGWPWAGSGAAGAGGSGSGGVPPPPSPWHLPQAAAAVAAAQQMGALGGRASGPPPPPPPPSGGAGASSAPGDGAAGADAGLASVLSRVKGEDVPKLVWSKGTSKASVYEEWMQKSTLKITGLHSTIELWWGSLRASVEAAYEEYISLDPLRRPLIRPQSSWAEAPGMRAVEMKFRPLLLEAMPETIQSQALATRQLARSEIVFAAAVEAGPGTLRDREATLKAVERRGLPGAPPVAECYAALQRWKFELTRLQRLGATAPDPTMQLSTLRRLVGKMCEHDRSFEHWLFSYEMSRGISGASSCSQAAVDEYWRYLAAEARELSGEDSAAKAPNVAAKVAALEQQIRQQTQHQQQTNARSDPKAKAKAKVKAKAKPEAKGKGKSGEPGQRPCRFFESDGGCRNGAQCTSLHRRPEKSEGKCFNCGAIDHKIDSCPRPRADPAARVANAGAAGDAAAAAAGASGPPAAGGGQPSGPPPALPKTAEAFAAALQQAEARGRSEGGQLMLNSLAAQGSGAGASARLAGGADGEAFWTSPAGPPPPHAKMALPAGDFAALERAAAAAAAPASASTLKRDQLGRPLLLADTGASHELVSYGHVAGEPASPPVATTSVELQIATGGREAQLGVDEKLYVYSPTELQPLFPLAAVNEELGLQMNWSPSICEVRLPDGRTIDFIRDGGSIYLDEDSADVLRQLRTAMRERRARAALARAIAAAVSLHDLERHRAEGHPRFMAERGECRRAAGRTRPHLRLDQTTRPGGQLSVDLSGPHPPGRWPSSWQEDQPRRAVYCMVAAFAVFTRSDAATAEENETFARAAAELQDPSASELADLEASLHPEAAASDAASTVAQRAAMNARLLIAVARARSQEEAREDEQCKDVQLPAEPRTWYYARPLATKTASETLAAMESINVEVCAELGCKAVYRIHADRAGELAGPVIKREMAARHDIATTSTAGAEPNSNGRAERAVGLVKGKARAMLLAPVFTAADRQALWPAAVCHAAWCQRRAAQGRSFAGIPPFGAAVHARLKDQQGSFEPRAVPRVYLGAVPDVTHGALLGHKKGGEWHFEVSSSFVVDRAAADSSPAGPPGAAAASDRVALPALPPGLPPGAGGAAAAEAGPTAAAAALVLPSDPVAIESAADHVEGRSDDVHDERGDDHDDDDTELPAFQEIDKESGMQPVSTAEIRASFGAEREGWRLALDSELSSLRSKGAFEVLTEAESAMVPKGKIIPMKVAAGTKPPLAAELERRKKAGRWSCAALDVATAFLNAPLPEEVGDIVVRPPSIFNHFGLIQPGELWRVRQAIYGLRIAPKAWGDKRDRQMRAMNIKYLGETCTLRQSHVDPCLWSVVAVSGKVAGYVCVYVDDFALFGLDAVVSELGRLMSETWKCSVQSLISFSAPGTIKYLSLSIEARPDGHYVHQYEHTNDLLEKWGLDRGNSAGTIAIEPLPAGDPELQGQEEPEIADIRLAQKMSGIAAYFHDCLIDWRSSKQPQPPRSTAEAEVTALAMGGLVLEGTEAVLNSMFAQPEVTKMWGDNSASLCIFQGHGSWRTRCLANRAAAIRARVEAKLLDLGHVPSEEQRADGLTKTFSVPGMTKIRAHFGLKDITTVVKPGDEVKVRVLAVDVEAGKLSLTMKEVGAPANKREEMLLQFKDVSADTWLPGKVKSFSDFGAFVEVTPPGADGTPVDGMVHISQIAEDPVEDPQEVLEQDQEVMVRVLQLTDGKMSLSMVPSEASGPVPAPAPA